MIILDAPTSNLDPASSAEIMDMLDELNCGGRTVIISTHDVDLAYRWADEVILMENDGVLCQGTGQEVFRDAELIKRARLKLPIVVDLYRELIGRGLLRDSNPPRNILEITDLIESRNQGTISRGSLGRIHICDVDQVGPQEIKSLLDASHVSYTGAMGTNAKMLAERAMIPVDFTYGVIDKCILKALTGKNSLIMTSGGMVDHTLHRIREYGEESGSRIEVIRLAPSDSSRAGSKEQEASSPKYSTKAAEMAQ